MQDNCVLTNHKPDLQTAGNKLVFTGHETYVKIHIAFV